MTKNPYLKEILFFSLILLAVSPVFAGDMPSFTDQDLNRYKKPSDVKKSQEKNKDEKSIYKLIDEPVSRKEEESQRVKRFEIPYKAYEGTARRIIINVTINGSVTAPMALDTGATGMIISPELADTLSLLNKSKLQLWITAGGIGGAVPAILTIIDTVQVGGAEDHFIPTTITTIRSDAFSGLIGMDFMANYNIEIDTTKHVVVFKELSLRSNMPGGHDEAWWRNNYNRFALERLNWKEYSKLIDKEYKSRENHFSNLVQEREDWNELKDFVNQQYHVADRLFEKLNGYAVDNAVPMEWRKY
jgi:aspartyl protease family protein